MPFTLIAAMGKNREIGKDNLLLWDLPEDMKHFRERTEGKTILMGRKTFESIGKPLPKRKNIVLTAQQDFSFEGIEVVHSLEEVLEMGKKEEIFVIGGAQIYQIFLPLATKMSLTLVQQEFPHSDAFFPEWQEEEWQETDRTEYIKNTEQPFSFSIIELQRISPSF
jgi:dihydrofolate reductase